MKKLLLLTKTLLAAALLCVGQNAWGQTPTLSVPSTFALNTLESPVPFDQGAIVTGTNIKAWSKNTDASVTANAWFDSDAGTDGNQPYTLSENETVTISFTAYEGWNGNTGSSTVKLVNSGGVSLAEYTYTPNTCNVKNVSFNGTTAEGYADFKGQSKNGAKDANGFNHSKQPYVTTANYNPTVTFTVSDNGYVTFTFVSANAGTQSFNATLPTSGGSAVTMDLARIQIVDNSPTSDVALGISNLSITSEVVAKHTVTFTYADTDGNSLSAFKANSTVQAAEGTSIESLITDAMKTLFYNGDESVRYDYSTYSVTGDITEVPSSDITVTLKFAAVERCNYSVNAVDGEAKAIKEGIISGICDKNQSASFYLPSCVLVDGKLYFRTAEDSYKSQTVTSNNQVFPYEYTTSSVDNVVFFVEGESISGASTSTPSGNQRLASKGYMGRGSNLNVTTLPAGVYTIYVKYINTNSGAHSLLVKAGDADVINATDVTVRPTKSGSVTLTEPTAITLTAAASSTSGVDYLYIVKTGEVATIGTYEYATFSSKYDLDFTTPISGLTAYKAASATSSTVTLEEVTGKVKAGDGLVIKGAAGTYPIPVTTGASTIYTDKSTINMWGYNGNETETVSKAGSGTNFVLSVQDEQVVFAPINGVSATLNPGQAALWANISISKARALRISFDDITAVENVEVAPAEAKAQDGKFIENGKLVIVKNGVKYNAAGAQVK